MGAKHDKVKKKGQEQTMEKIAIIALTTMNKCNIRAKLLPCFVISILSGVIVGHL
jgi:hypothetical protein